LESAYEACLFHELRNAGLKAQAQVSLPVSLKFSGKKVGLLINFNVLHLKDGIRRIVNQL
jgi:hypothetical protein